MGPPLCLHGSSVRLLLIFVLSFVSVGFGNPLQNSIELWHGDPHTSPGPGAIFCDGSSSYYDPRCLPEELVNRSLSCEADLQGIGSLDTLCILEKKVELVVADSIIAGKGTLEILSHASLACFIPGCNITIVLLGNLIVNGPINTGSLIIQVQNVTVGKESSVSARGLGGEPPATSTGTPLGLDGAGGGHGGRGAQCVQDGDKDQADLWGGDDYAWPTLASPWSFGSQGSSTSKKGDYGGKGGGRVNITAFGVLEVHGIVDADGGAGGECGGGGSGGSVVIRTSELRGNGEISASGGSGRAGGGGGRVSVNAQKNSGVKIFARGGLSFACPNNTGGAGTQFDVTRQILIVSNDNFYTQTETLLMDFPHFPLWESLLVDGRAKALIPLLWSRVQVRGSIRVVSESAVAFGLSLYQASEFEVVCDQVQATNATIKVYGALKLQTKMLFMENSTLYIQGGDDAYVGTSDLEASSVASLRDGSVIVSNSNLGVHGQGLLKLNGSGDIIKAERLFISLFFTIHVGPGAVLQAPLDYNSPRSDETSRLYCMRTTCPEEAISPSEEDDVHLDVSAVELVGGGCSADGFQVDSCDGFPLAPGQSAELFVSFQPDLTAGVFQRDVRLITSTGVVQISLGANLPDNILRSCLEMAQSTNLERAFLFVAIVALVVVLGVFFRMLVQEIALQQERVSTSGLKCVPQHKVGGRPNAPLPFTPTNGVVGTKTSGSPVVGSGRLKCSSGEPEVQSRTGDGTGASGPGRPKESIKGLVRALKDSFTGTMGATVVSEDSSKADMAPPAGLPGLRVKIPNSAALNGQKPTLGSPMREASSPSSTHFRKGMTEKRSQARFDGVQAKIAPENLEESLPAPVKQSPTPKSVVNRSSLVDDGENSHLETITPPSNSVSVSGPPVARSPRKGSQFNQLKQGLSPKSRPSLSSPGTGMNEKDRGKRKKGRSNVGNVKHRSVSKTMSGSSSPSSPASPATPASPSRPISPLLHSDLQPNLMAVSSPNAFSSLKDPGGSSSNISSPLAKLDVRVERHSSTSTAASTGKTKEIPGRTIYRRSDSLSVDVASTALRDMAQAKATDLSWSTLSGKGNRSIENRSSKANDSIVGKRSVPKDWATVARKATLETAIPNNEVDIPDDRRWDRMTWMPQNGQGGSPGPALTPSATFPRRQDRRSEWSFTDSVEDVQGLIQPVGSSPTFVPVSTIPPAARAPGAKIAKPFLDDSSADLGCCAKGEYSQEGSNSCGEMFENRSDGSPRFMPGITAEDQRVYDIWGNHFGEISRCATQQIGSVTTGGAPLPSLAVLDSTPSFFSSFPQPNFPGDDNSAILSPALTSITAGFSVFSQAPDIETFCLPSTLFHSPKTVPSMSRVYTDVSSVGNKFGHGRNGLKGHNGLGGSLPGSPRKPLGPYAPPLGPSPMANEVVPLASPATTSDPSSSFWSGSSLQEGGFTTAIHSRS